MERLIGDLLDLASIDSGTLTLDRAPHPVEALVGELRDAFAPQATARKLQLLTEVEPALPALECDRERVLQALSNLLSNALKYTPQGTVVVSARRDPCGVAISVQDTGKGIAPQDLPHVFDQYWHASPGRDSHGLGLAIARGIVERHGGQLTVQSEPGRGSTFTAGFPARVEPPTG
jgi:signal transduction histidine kinase